MDTNDIKNIDNTLTSTAIDLIGNPEIVSDVQGRNDLQQQFPRTRTTKNNGMSITAVREGRVPRKKTTTTTNNNNNNIDNNNKKNKHEEVRKN